MKWWEGEGQTAPSIRDADREDARREQRDWQDANDTMSFDELKDLGIPRFFPVKPKEPTDE